MAFIHLNKTKWIKNKIKNIISVNIILHMKPKKLHLLLLAVILINCHIAFSQKFFEMMEDENANYYDVQKEANTYFKIHGTDK